MTAEKFYDDIIARIDQILPQIIKATQGVDSEAQKKLDEVRLLEVEVQEKRAQLELLELTRRQDELKNIK